MFFGQFFLAQPVIAEHEVVVCLQVFGIDGQDGLQNFHRFIVLALQEENASQIVQSDAIPRILGQDSSESRSGPIVVAIGSQHFGVKEIRARQIG